MDFGNYHILLLLHYLTFGYISTSNNSEIQHSTISYWPCAVQNFGQSPTVGYRKFISVTFLIFSGILHSTEQIDKGLKYFGGNEDKM